MTFFFISFLALARKGHQILDLKVYFFPSTTFQDITMKRFILLALSSFKKVSALTSLNPIIPLILQ